MPIINGHKRIRGRRPVAAGAAAALLALLLVLPLLQPAMTAVALAHEGAEAAAAVSLNDDDGAGAWIRAGIDG